MQAAFLTTSEMGEIVTLIAGEDEVSLIAHLSILSAQTRFFEAAFSKTNGFKESITRTMYLPEDDSIDMTHLIDWCYTSKLPPSDSTTPQDLVYLYILAEKYLITPLMNQTMVALQTRIHNIDQEYGPELIAIIYANTHQNSKLRAFCAAATASLEPQRRPVDYKTNYGELLNSRVGFEGDVFSLNYKYTLQIQNKTATTSRAGDESFCGCEFLIKEMGKECEDCCWGCSEWRFMDWARKKQGWSDEEMETFLDVSWEDCELWRDAVPSRKGKEGAKKVDDERGDLKPKGSKRPSSDGEETSAKRRKVN